MCFGARERLRFSDSAPPLALATHLFRRIVARDSEGKGPGGAELGWISSPGGENRHGSHYPAVPIDSKWPVSRLAAGRSPKARPFGREQAWSLWRQPKSYGRDAKIVRRKTFLIVQLVRARLLNRPATRFSPPPRELSSSWWDGGGKVRCLVTTGARQDPAIENMR